MSNPYKSNINALCGYYLFNRHQLSYEDCISSPSVRIPNPEELKDITIHKFIPLQYLLVLLKEKRLILNRVSAWEDPYENFFLKQHFVKPGDLKASYYVSVEDHTKGLYGMSWTLQEETDSLWRVYSPNKMSVRISCKIRALVETVSSEDNKWGIWLDEVQYLSERKMKSWLKQCRSISTFEQFVDKMRESFFIKRKAFEAEKEFRLIVNFQKEDNAPVIFFRCDPDIMVETIHTDPRLTKYEYEAVRAALIGTGVNEDKIKASKLYSFKPLKIEMPYDLMEDF